MLLPETTASSGRGILAGGRVLISCDVNPRPISEAPDCTGSDTDLVRSTPTVDNPVLKREACGWWAFACPDKRDDVADEEEEDEDEEEVVAFDSRGVGNTDE